MKNIKKILVATLFSSIFSVNIHAAMNYDLLEPASYDTISWSNKLNILNGIENVSSHNEDQIDPIIIDDIATFEQQEIGEVFYLPIPARELTRELVKITAQKSSIANCTVRIVDGNGNEIQKIIQGSVPADDNILNNNTKVSFGFIYEHQENVRLEFIIDAAERSSLSFSTMMLSISRIKDNPLAEHFLTVRARDDGYNVIANNRRAHYSDDSDSDSDSDDEDWGEATNLVTRPLIYTPSLTIHEHFGQPARPLPAIPSPAIPSPIIAPAIIPEDGLSNVRNARERFRQMTNANAPVAAKPNYLINRENQQIYTRLEAKVNAYIEPMNNIHRNIEDMNRKVNKKETKINLYKNEVQTLGEHVRVLTKDNLNNHSHAFHQNYNKMTAKLNAFIAKLDVLKGKIRLDKTVLEDNVANIQEIQNPIATECAKKGKLESLEQKYARLCESIERAFTKADVSVREMENALVAIDHINVDITQLKDDLVTMKRHISFLIYGPIPNYFGPDPVQAAPVVVTPVQPVIIEPVLPDNFDELVYLDLHADLHNHAIMMPTIEDRKAFAKWHYVNHGRNKGRKYLEVIPVDFDALTYLRLNEDLNVYAQTLPSDEAKIAFAESHYLDNGHKHNRRYLDLPKDFDALTYISLHQDLNNYARTFDSRVAKIAFAHSHYLKHGKTAGRRYLDVPVDFNALMYLQLNPDLERATMNMGQAEKIEWAKNHYLNHGRNKGRKYS